MISDEKLRQLLERFTKIQGEMAKGADDMEVFIKLSKEFAELEPIAEAARKLLDLRTEIKDMRAMADGADKEMAELAWEELPEAREREKKMTHDLQVMLLPKDEADAKNVILEVRAGTGGDEAALFAGDLFRMYCRHAELQGWKVNILSVSESDVGGYKEVSASITGTGVFAQLKFESGVHRVQRVPATESGGRIHTSAATVAVLPEAEEVDVQINESDLRIDTYRASGAGGQHVNTTDSAVRITHIPTNTVVTVQDERSQHKNKAKAMKVLRARIYDNMRQIADAERTEARKGQVGTGDRSERIRTYNFPQGRVSDHRINLTLYKLDRLIAGDALHEMIDALQTEDQANRLAAIEA